MVQCAGHVECIRERRLSKRLLKVKVETLKQMATSYIPPVSKIVAGGRLTEKSGGEDFGQELTSDCSIIEEFLFFGLRLPSSGLLKV